MTHGEAWGTLIRAGAQFESMHEAIIRVIPDDDAVIRDMESRGFTAERVGSIMVGMALGLLMADDPMALAIAHEIIENGGTNNA